MSQYQWRVGGRWDVGCVNGYVRSAPEILCIAFTGMGVKLMGMRWLEACAYFAHLNCRIECQRMDIEVTHLW
jgi:hypothetical protein